MRLPHQGDRITVEGQAIETRTVLAGEGLQPPELALGLEHHRVALDREGGVVDAGAATGRLLGLARVGGRIGAQEELRIPRGGGGHQGKAMAFPLGHRQAVEIGPQAAAEHGVAVDVQVVGRDRGRQVGSSAAHEVGGLGGGDVFEHHLQPWMVA